jgi:hypothetical protein
MIFEYLWVHRAFSQISNAVIVICQKRRWPNKRFDNSRPRPKVLSDDISEKDISTNEMTSRKRHYGKMTSRKWDAIFKSTYQNNFQKRHFDNWDEITKKISQKCPKVLSDVSAKRYFVKSDDLSKLPYQKRYKAFSNNISKMTSRQIIRQYVDFVSYNITIRHLWRNIYLSIVPKSLFRWSSKMPKYLPWNVSIT